MQLSTGGDMLNFGYWDVDNDDPISAQNNLCMKFAEMAELSSGKNILDVGSGLSAPSMLWRTHFPNSTLFDININFKQLSHVGPQNNIQFLNSTSTKLPVSDSSMDRVLALESAQHFKPLSDFISESKRVLTKSGILVLAIPITLEKPSLHKLGILKFTWSSEHYELNQIKQLLDSFDFKILEEQLIGKSVYSPLADYYVQNRDILKKNILKHYPNYVEKILYKSILKMKKASENKIIDYVLLKCTLKS